MIAVNGSAMQDVPGLIRTPELCLEAVRQDGKALEHVPYRLRRASLCLEAGPKVRRAKKLLGLAETAGRGTEGGQAEKP